MEISSCKYKRRKKLLSSIGDNLEDNPQALALLSSRSTISTVTVNSEADETSLKKIQVTITIDAEHPERTH